MSAPPPPPSYNESMQTQGAYQPSYGATNAPPPPVGYGQPQGTPYPPQGAPYPPQYAPVGGNNQHNKGFVPGPPSYQTQTTTSVMVNPTQSVVLVGGCPACRVGVLEDDFTCCGVLCAILFFPLGILCCLAMRQRRCGNCGSVFG